MTFTHNTIFILSHFLLLYSPAPTLAYNVGAEHYVPSGGMGFGVSLPGSDSTGWSSNELLNFLKPQFPYIGKGRRVVIVTLVWKGLCVVSSEHSDVSTGYCPLFYF